MHFYSRYDHWNIFFSSSCCLFKITILVLINRIVLRKVTISSRLLLLQRKTHWRNIPCLPCSIRATEEVKGASTFPPLSIWVTEGKFVPLSSCHTDQVNTGVEVFLFSWFHLLSDPRKVSVVSVQLWTPGFCTLLIWA